MWSYEEAFKRNLGLIAPEEQKILRGARVAIVGQGGVGGVHLVTLARLGVGKFTIADPDTFETANFNRQYGATVSSLGKSKVEEMARIAKDINPEIDIRTFRDPLNASNADDFLRDADIFIDGIDVFEIDTRRMLFRKAAEKGIYGITAGPLGFSTAWLVFSPTGMTFDRYFNINDEMDMVSKFSAFLVGLTPKATHRDYMDMSYLSIKNRYGPSAGLACQLCSGVAAAESLKILLKRPGLHPVPYYHQFDSYKGRLASGYLMGGNRHPLQRFKQWMARRMIGKLFTESAAPARP